jgi:dihydroorotate dehydrogenase electron transfer subunit
VREDICRYIDLIKYLELDNSKDSIIIDDLLNKTLVVLPNNFQSTLVNFSNDNKFKTLIGKNLSNKKSYNTFCFNVLSLLISKKLGYEICYINDKYFDKTFLSLISDSQSITFQDKIITNNCAFAVKKNETSIVFSFGHQSERSLNELSNHIFTIDNNEYKNLHIIIFKNSEELNVARQIKKANKYKRCFFTSFDKICSKVIEIDKDSYEKIFSPKWDYCKNKYKFKSTASLHNISIIDNIPVGTEESKLYKLTFKSENSIDILPGQFIMIDTLKERQIKMDDYSLPKIHRSITSVRSNIHNDLFSNRLSYLKRPFGIYRTYYENFNFDCSSKLILEKELSAILYTVKPNKFEILYKVLIGGVGTNELTKLVKNDKIEILAPLGKIFDLREVLKGDIDEIHIVGGGVGFAPLVNLVQMLRYFGFKVKAFIGIEKYSSLKYNDEDIDPQSFTSSSRNARIYIDDLKFLGLSESSDIYLSLMSDDDDGQTIDIKNVYKGFFITEPYADYLKKCNNLKILTFTCGPIPMMHKVHNITSQYNITSYVLMEKRMACGIGVCFSCVCKTFVKNENHYSRVCIDGPIIESKKINWNE